VARRHYPSLRIVAADISEVNMKRMNSLGVCDLVTKVDCRDRLAMLRLVAHDFDGHGADLVGM